MCDPEPRLLVHRVVRRRLHLVHVGRCRSSHAAMRRLHVRRREMADMRVRGVELLLVAVAAIV